MKRRVAVWGSTGSIGVNALDVVRRLNRQGASVRVDVLSAHSNIELLKKQMEEFRPSRAVVGDPAGVDLLARWARAKKRRVRIGCGVDGLLESARSAPVDLVVSAVVGAVGLTPLLAALRAGKNVALANKESLIVAGELVMETARRSGARVIPVDSEHSALFQCLGGRIGSGQGVRRLILTASGGAFYRHKGSLAKVGVDQALNHPTWKMGKKITVDCATLTNKGLEAIEAHHLFAVPMDRIAIVIHPQSIVHSLVEFDDGSMLAQLSHPDMRLPIQYALTFPDRRPTSVKSLELDEIGRLEFHRPQFQRFPSLSIALDAGRRGGLWPAVFNAANEVAVNAFIHRRAGFMDIPHVCRRVLGDYRPKGSPLSLPDILAADQWGRRAAHEVVQTLHPCPI